MRYGKSIGIALVVVLAIAGGVLALTLSNIDSQVTNVVETSGSHVTGTPVTVGGLSLNVLEGTGGISGVHVANPQGFSSGDVLTLGRISVDIDAATVSQDPLVLQKVVIRSPRIFYEIDSEDMSNLEVVQTHIRTAMAAGKGQPAAGDIENITGPRVIIASLIIEQGTADIQPNPGQDQKMSVTLPRMVLQDIGKKTQGATPDEVSEIIVSALFNNTRQTLDSLGLDRLVKRNFAWKVGEAAEDTGDFLGDTADTVGKKIKSGAYAVGNAAGEAVDKVRDFLGK